MRKLFLLAFPLAFTATYVAAESPVPPAVQDMRIHMNDAGINSFTFRNMRQLFETRTVGRAGPVWQFDVAYKPLDFTYEFAGEERPASDVFENTQTNALLIIKNGKIVYENYRNRSRQDTPFISWSMAKSFTTVLVGLAVEEGYIKSIDDDITAYLPELKEGAYAGVTIRQILEMRSGVDYEERYDFENPGVAATNHMRALVRNEVRFADAARTLKRLHEPGSVFQYKTIDTAVLGWLVERATRRTVSAYMAEKIWEPLGMEADGFWIMDGAPGIGREFTGAGFNAVERDYARFGLMILNGGVGNGKRIINNDWVKMVTEPSHPESPEGGYGMQWWTAPNSDAFYALGLQGQYIYIDPATKTVVVKASYYPISGQDEPNRETLAFMRAAALWQPE